MPEQNQPINTLPIKTASGVTATDYILGIGSAEEYQMLIQDLGDYIIQHAQSSLAGLNQTLASAISRLNSNLPTKPFQYDGYKDSSFNCNDALPGVVYCADSVVNIPVRYAGMLVTFSRTDHSKSQLFLTVNGELERIYKRAYNRFTATWSSWVSYATTTEIDALNDRVTALENQ